MYLECVIALVQKIAGRGVLPYRSLVLFFDKLRERNFTSPLIWITKRIQSLVFIINVIKL